MNETKSSNPYMEVGIETYCTWIFPLYFHARSTQI